MNIKLNRTIRYLLTLFLLCLTLTGCGSSSNAKSTQKEFDTFLNDVFVSEVQNDSITLNYTLSDPTAFGITDVTPTLGEYSVSYMKEYLATLENYKTRMESFDYKKLTTDQKKTYDVLYEYIEDSLIDEDLILYGEILGPSTGIQAQLPVLLSEYHFNSKEDIENYLALLSCVDDYFTQIISFESEKADAGLFMSDDTADDIINQCTIFADATNDNAIIEVFDDRIDDIEWLDDQEKSDYKKENKEKVINEVIPAYEVLINGLKSLKGSGKNEEGLAHFEKGKEYYEYLIRSYTGSSRSIKEISKGLESVIDDNILTIQKVVTENPEILDEVSDATFSMTDPNEILDFLKEDIKDGYPALEAVNYQVKYVPESLQEYLSPAFYLSPTIDKYTDNCIYINTFNSYDLSDIFTTLAHEGYPGHLYQSVYYNQQNPYPIRNLLSFTGYSEGWASYAEYDSYDRAGLSENVAAVLKANQIAMICMYADIDIGINYYGWSYDDTKEYLDKFGIRDDSDIAKVYTAMVEEPGVYLKYAGGYCEILKLEEEAKDLMGKDYDVEKFREYLLTFGPAQFDVIEKYMRQEL